MSETLASQLSDHLQHEDQRTLPDRLLNFHHRYAILDEAAAALDAQSALLAEAKTALEQTTAETIESPQKHD